VLTAANFKFSLSLDFAKDSKTGLILMQGGHYGLQKSTAKAGDSFISFCSYCKFYIYITFSWPDEAVAPAT
jgi:hypothetical protein